MPATPVAAPLSVSVGLSDGGAFTPVAVLSVGQTSIVFTVELYGNDVYKEWVAVNNSDVAVTVAWTEYNMIGELDDI